jgi:hypothetical protein
MIENGTFDIEQYNALIGLLEIEMEAVYKKYGDLPKPDAIRMCIMCDNIYKVAPQTMRFNKMIKRMLYAVGAFEGVNKQQIADMNPLTCVPKYSQTTPSKATQARRLKYIEKLAKKMKYHATLLLNKDNSHEQLYK